VVVNLIKETIKHSDKWQFYIHNYGRIRDEYLLLGLTQDIKLDERAKRVTVKR
jgi:hypothetical protein